MTRLPPVLVASLALGMLVGASRAAGAPAPAPSPAVARARCPHVADATTLVPDGAKAIVQLDGNKTFRSPLYRELRSALDRDLELKDGLAVLDACGLGLEDITELTAGVGPNDETVAIIQAGGIGSADTLGCLRKRLAARHDGQPPWTTRREGCYRVLADAGDDFAFVLDDSTIVLTRHGWADQVRGLIQGKGQSAATTGSAGALAGVDRTRALWFTMTLSDADRGTLQGSAAANLESLAGAIDFARGLDLGARLQLADPGAAAQMRDELSTYRDLIEGMGALPKGMAKRLRVDASGRAVDLSVALSASELEQLRRTLEPRTKGKNPL